MVSGPTFRNDDDTLSVDAVFLGPPAWSLPWRARYSAYAIGLPVFVVVLAVIHRAGVGAGFSLLGYSLLVTVAITTAIGKRLSYDRRIRAVVATLGHELTAPRPTKGTTATLSLAKVRVTHLPSGVRPAPVATGSLPPLLWPLGHAPASPTGSSER